MNISLLVRFPAKVVRGLEEISEDSFFMLCLRSFNVLIKLSLSKCK